MTLSQRNLFFKAGIIISSLSIFICIISSITAISVYEEMESNITHFADSFFNMLTGSLANTNLLAVHISILGMSLYSLLSILFINYFFEKTQSKEILFVSFFVVSFSLEALRFVIPISLMYNIPSMYLLFASRIIIFSRYFGIFSLFAASVYAVGYQSRTQHTFIFIIIITTWIIALGIPVDTQTWDSSFNMIKGYSSMFKMIDIGVFLISTGSFFIAAWQRSNREFLFIGTGTVLVFIGRDILLNADNWLGMPIGLPCLAIGTWLICTYLHKIYLWY
ncbi:MAG: hypothetical protein FWH41_11010 [Treponema sp.]|nr:hypothetical protein [Treponema sp.]